MMTIMFKPKHLRKAEKAKETPVTLSEAEVSQMKADHQKNYGKRVAEALSQHGVFMDARGYLFQSNEGGYTKVKYKLAYTHPGSEEVRSLKQLQKTYDRMIAQHNNVMRAGGDGCSVDDVNYRYAFQATEIDPWLRAHNLELVDGKVAFIEEVPSAAPTL